MPRYTSFVGAAAAATLCTLLAACGSDSTSPNNTVTSTQINTDVAYSTASDVGSDYGDYTYYEGTIASGAQGGRLSNAMRAMGVPSQSECGDSTFAYTITWNADTLTASRTATAFSLGACNRATIDSVAFVGVDSLAVNDVRWVRHAVRQRQFDVVGAPSLDSAALHVWNGVANGHDSSTWSGTVNTRVYSGLAYDTTTDLTFNHPRASAIYPDSGTFSRWANWTLNVTGAKTETLAVSRHFVVTFNGTEFVPVVIYDTQTGSAVLTCSIDLGLHRLVPNSCDNPR